jgi:uncharacterized protein YecA (UPF0149 family)
MGNSQTIIHESERTRQRLIQSSNIGSFCTKLQSSTRQENQLASKKPKVGRNDPCPCGSGKKFKKCCSMAGQVIEFQNDSGLVETR